MSVAKMGETKLKIGGSAVEDGVDFVAAWHRIEKGDARGERVIAFESWDGLAKVMTSERLRLLRHLRSRDEPSIMALAKALGRQYRRVHDDVSILVRSGLVGREHGTLYTNVDRIETVIELA